MVIKWRLLWIRIPDFIRNKHYLFCSLVDREYLVSKVLSLVNKKVDTYSQIIEFTLLEIKDIEVTLQNIEDRQKLENY